MSVIFSNSTQLTDWLTAISVIVCFLLDQFHLEHDKFNYNSKEFGNDDHNSHFYLMPGIKITFKDLITIKKVKI